MTETTAEPSVAYLGVQFSLAGIASVYGARTSLFIPRDDIHSIALKYGYPGERRLFQLILGFVLLGIALWQLGGVLLYLYLSGKIDISSIGVVLPLTGVGTWLLYDAFHRAWFFEVETHGKIKKLPVEGKPSPEIFKQFLVLAQRLGYVIDVSALPVV